MILIRKRARRELVIVQEMLIQSIQEQVIQTAEKRIQVNPQISQQEQMIHQQMEITQILKKQEQVITKQQILKNIPVQQIRIYRTVPQRSIPEVEIHLINQHLPRVD